MTGIPTKETVLSRTEFAPMRLSFRDKKIRIYTVICVKS